MTFKKLVERIAQGVKTWDEFNEVGGQISRSFDTEKITYKDYEMLYDLLAMAGTAEGLN